MKRLVSFLLTLAMILSFAVVPVSAEEADVKLKITPDVTSVDTSDEAVVTYTVEVEVKDGVNVGAFQFTFASPTGMTLPTAFKEAGETVIQYKDKSGWAYSEEDETGIFDTFGYTAKTGVFIASGTTVDRNLSETKTLMTIKAKVAAGTTGSLVLNAENVKFVKVDGITYLTHEVVTTAVEAKSGDTPTPPAHTHTLTKVDAQAATCTEDGYEEYYKCSGTLDDGTICGKLFSDADGKTEITAPVAIPAGHTYGDLIPEVSATCGTAGVKAHYECSVCHLKFDADKNEITELTIPATGKHDWEITKGEDGNNQHILKCKVCKLTQDELHTDRDGDVKDEWEHDETHHWNKYTCGTIMNKAEHSWNDGEVTTPATCTAEGVKTYTCNTCKATKTETIAKTAHTYGEPEWTWKDDNGGKLGTATFKCTACGIYQAESANATATVTKEPTCTETGTTTYTATVSFEDTDYTGTTTVTTPEKGHSYGEPVWNWKFSDDPYPATVTFTCTVDDHVESVSAKVTSSNKNPATCTENGSETYTAEATFEGKTYTNTYTGVLPATGHNLTETPAKAANCTTAGNSAYWTCGTCNKFFSDKDGKTEIAKDSWVIDALKHDFTGEYISKDDAGHVRKCTRCDATSDVVPHNYPAHKCDETATCTDCHYVKPAGTHAWSKVDYTWSDDFTTCTATVTCTNNCGEKQTETVNTVKTTVAATCTTDGKYTYTATFTNALFTEQVKEITIPAIKHAYGDPVWNWAADGKSATATFTCANDNSHVENVSAKVTSAVKTPATCTVMGTTTYTAKVTFGGKDYTSAKDVQDIALVAHTLIKTPAKANTCTEAGNNEYNTCSVCKAVFKADKTTPTTVAAETLSALGHDLKVTAAVTPTCVAGGNNKYYTCSRCKAVFKDAAGKTPTTVAAETLAKDPTNHTGGTEQRGAVSATCATNGRTADTYCKGCGVRTAVGDAIPATGKHTYDANGVCATCGNKKPSVASDDLKPSTDEKTVEGGGWVIKPDDGGKVETDDLNQIKDDLKNGNIKAVIETIISNADNAKDELESKINSATDAAEKVLKELQRVTGSSTRKLFGVYGVSMKLTGADATAETLGESQNVTIAISEEDYNALKSGTKKMIQAYMDGDTAKSRELNVTLGGNATNGYTVTFAVDKSATYALVADTYTPSGGSYTPSGKTFTTDLPAGSITGVYVNGKKLDSKYYVISGSSVTLTDAYLATLKAGKYTVKIENATHVSTGTFTVAANGALSPKTGDAGMVWYAAMAVSSLLGTAVVTKKRRESK